MLITGNRGCGKTVLLRELERVAGQRGWVVISDTASLGLCDRLQEALEGNRPRVSSFEVGPSFDHMSIEIVRERSKRLRY